VAVPARTSRGSSAGEPHGRQQLLVVALVEIGDPARRKATCPRARGGSVRTPPAAQDVLERPRERGYEQLLAPVGFAG